MYSSSTIDRYFNLSKHIPCTFIGYLSPIMSIFHFVVNSNTVPSMNLSHWIEVIMHVGDIHVVFGKYFLLSRRGVPIEKGCPGKSTKYENGKQFQSEVIRDDYLFFMWMCVCVFQVLLTNESIFCMVSIQTLFQFISTLKP